MALTRPWAGGDRNATDAHLDTAPPRARAGALAGRHRVGPGRDDGADRAPVPVPTGAAGPLARPGPDRRRSVVAAGHGAVRPVRRRLADRGGVRLHRRRRGPGRADLRAWLVAGDLPRLRRDRPAVRLPVGAAGRGRLGGRGRAAGGGVGLAAVAGRAPPAPGPDLGGALAAGRDRPHREAGPARPAAAGRLRRGRPCCCGGTGAAGSPTWSPPPVPGSRHPESAADRERDWALASTTSRPGGANLGGEGPHGLEGGLR